MIAVEIANATVRRPGAHDLGAGSTAVASDSTHFGAYDQNIFTEWHSLRRSRRADLLARRAHEHGHPLAADQLLCVRGRRDDRGGDAARHHDGGRGQLRRLARPCRYLDTLPLVEGQVRPAGPSCATVPGCLCGYGSNATRMAPSGSTCWMSVVSRSITVSMTSGSVTTVRTTSTSLSTGAGLKKCIPTTWSGRLVCTASSVIDKLEVLDARMTSPRTIPSSSVNSRL